MENSRRELLLMCVCLVALMVGYAVYSHRSSKVKTSSEMMTGLKVITDPELVVKDLEQ
jgi:hypothetical protein